jgi:hypothetical protein
MRKLTLTLSDRDYQMIEDLAKNKEQGKTDVFRDALSLAKWYADERALGSRILIERPGGKLREVEIF